MPREKHKWEQPQGKSTDAEHWDGPTRMSGEGPVMGLEQRGWIKQLRLAFNWQQEEADECSKAVYYSKTASDGGF